MSTNEYEPSPEVAFWAGVIIGSFVMIVVVCFLVVLLGW